MENKRSVLSLKTPTIARAQNYWRVTESFINSVIILKVKKNSKKILGVLHAPPRFRQWKKNTSLNEFIPEMQKLKTRSSKDKTQACAGDTLEPSFFKVVVVGGGSILSREVQQSETAGATRQQQTEAKRRTLFHRCCWCRWCQMWSRNEVDCQICVMWVRQDQPPPRQQWACYC